MLLLYQNKQVRIKQQTGSRLFDLKHESPNINSIKTISAEHITKPKHVMCKFPVCKNNSRLSQSVAHNVFIQSCLSLISPIKPLKEIVHPKNSYAFLPPVCCLSPRNPFQINNSSPAEVITTARQVRCWDASVFCPFPSGAYQHNGPQAHTVCISLIISFIPLLSLRCSGREESPLPYLCFLCLWGTRLLL